MNSAEFKFLCPHCAQGIKCEISLAGSEVQCPSCAQLLRIPHPSDEPGLDAAADPFPETDTEPARRAVINLRASLLALACGFLGYQTATTVWELRFGIRGDWLVVTAGIVLGLLLGWRLGTTRTPSASSAFTFAVGAWALLILTWGWVLTRPAGSFNDQGGMVLTFAILPLTVGCWLVGGPLALALGHRAIKRTQAAEGAAGDRSLARMGVILSRTMLWGGVALAVIVFWR